MLSFWRKSKLRISQPLCTIGLQKPRTRLVFLQSLVHPPLPFPRTSIRNLPGSVLVKDIKMLIYISSLPSTVYVLFISLTIINGCGSTLAEYATSTASIPHDQLSSIDGKGKAQRYNLGHLPCPPAGIRAPPGQLYHPQLAWVGQFHEFADPAIARACPTIGGAAGFRDPPTAFPTALGGLNGTGEAGTLHPRRIEREPANAPVAPCMPTRTPTAT